MEFFAIRNGRWLLAIFVLASIVDSGFGLRCWQCSSDLSPECDEEMNNSDHHRLFHTKDCESTLSQYPYSHEKMVCRKTVQQVHSQRIVIRSCSVLSPDELREDRSEGQCSKTSMSSNTESCHYCSTDLCNGVTGIHGFSVFSLAFVTIITYFLNK